MLLWSPSYAAQLLVAPNFIVARCTASAVASRVTLAGEHPDISTTDAFKKAPLAAKSVSFTDPAGGGTAAVFVTDAVKKNAVPFDTGRDDCRRAQGGRRSSASVSPPSSFRSKA
jgi:hypothetical protein